ncbi:amidohydrolase family protein [Cupriavidus oxalaticus]|uniref:amidohydrolase family protein n=1 Tax=Cupriavidus oxalaticus TaxID=96344 RepID=UPI0031710320
MAPTMLSSAPPCAAPLASVKYPRRSLPENACDSHLHILGPVGRFPYASERVYTPPDCLMPDYERVRRYLGVTRCVLVQPSVYGSDNRVLLDALKGLGREARGVVVLRGDEPRDILHLMHGFGVRGVRVNVVDVQSARAELPREQLLRLADLVGPLGWHIELLMHVDRHPDMKDVLANLGVPVVFGHMGYLSRGVTDYRGPEMQAMVSLMKAGLAWAKVTAPYRLDDAPAYHKARQIARWLGSECMDRLVWGSDWPHVMVRTDMPHDADLVDVVTEWFPGAEQQKALFAANAARLYGWP